MSLRSSNVLVRLSIHTYDGVVKDKKVSAEVKRNNGADYDSGNFYKKLMPYWISQINQVKGKARTLHYRMTAPWDKRGRDILPNKMFFDYESGMIPLQSEFFDLVKQFEREYDNLVLKDANRLQGMYNISDYKAKDKVFKAYEFNIEYEPIPDSGHVFLDVEAKDASKLQSHINDVTNEKLGDAMKDVWRRLYEPVAHMVDRLSNPDAKKLHDSIVENIRDICSFLPELNLTGDPALTLLIQEVQQKLAYYPVEDLKDNEIIRHSVVNDAEDLLVKMQGYM